MLRQSAVGIGITVLSIVAVPAYVPVGSRLGSLAPPTAHPVLSANLSTEALMQVPYRSDLERITNPVTKTAFFAHVQKVETTP